jgi:hypothetical protein
MSIDPFAVAPIMGLLATTGEAGFALQNATPTILTWTAPSDGQLHRVFVIGNAHVTSAETGGGVQLSFNLPDGLAATSQILNSGLAAGNQNGNFQTKTVGPGSTVSVSQSSALTAGAATFWGEIWGS